MARTTFQALTTAMLFSMLTDAAMAQTPWRPDHTVVVVMENLSAYEATPAQRSEGHAPVYGQLQLVLLQSVGGARCQVHAVALWQNALWLQVAHAS
jgi:hypothetical protein